MRLAWRQRGQHSKPSHLVSDNPYALLAAISKGIGVPSGIAQNVDGAISSLPTFSLSKNRKDELSDLR